MEAIEYELIFDQIDTPTIEADFYSTNKIYCGIEKTADGDHLYLFNPEYAFEKQQIINADTNRIIKYLHIQEKYPEQYQRFVKNGTVYIRTSHANISVFLIHSLTNSTS